MNYIIITGTSRGIGEAIAGKLLENGNILFCISRTMNEHLIETASGKGIPLYYYEGDISKPMVAVTILKDIFQKIVFSDHDRIALINNAGTIEPIGPAGKLKTGDIEQHYRTNLLAPALLINHFIKLCAGAAVQKVILNISSGASEYPYHGWSMYCSSKAGLDMLTRTIALEQDMVPNPVKLFALKPGIVETSMQKLIRQAKPGNFHEKEKFIKLHNDGLLIKPEEVADTIAGTLFADTIPQGALLSLKQLKEYIK